VGFALAILIFHYRTGISQLVDHVFIDGETLVIHNRGVEDRVPFQHIGSVYNEWFSLESIELLLLAPSQFGGRIKFLAPCRFFRFSQHPLAIQLSEIAARSRVSQAEPNDHESS